MTNKEKLDLQWQVRFLLGDGKSDSYIVDFLHKREGYEKNTIKKYIKAFSK